MNEIVYTSGEEAFRDTCIKYGIQEGLTILGNYIGLQMRGERSADERRFCRELFAALYDGAIIRDDPARMVYPYDAKAAAERGEVAIYRDNSKRNTECARAIDEAINASHYTQNHYNLDLAAMKVVHDYGFERVHMVLAANLRLRTSDGRFSSHNMQWGCSVKCTRFISSNALNATAGRPADRQAKTLQWSVFSPRVFTAGENTCFDMPISSDAFRYAFLNAHPTLIEDFCKHTRELYDEVDAKLFAMPGTPEKGVYHEGYEIINTVAFTDRSGFSIGHNPTMVNPFITCVMNYEDGERSFSDERYYDSKESAEQDFIARTISHMSGYDTRGVTERNPSHAVSENPNTPSDERGGDAPSNKHSGDVPSNKRGEDTRDTQDLRKQQASTDKPAKSQVGKKKRKPDMEL